MSWHCLRCRRPNLRELAAEVVGDGESGVNIAGETSSEKHAAFARAKFFDALLHLWAEVSHETLNGPGCCVAERTDGAAFDLFAARRRKVR